MDKKLKKFLACGDWADYRATFFSTSTLIQIFYSNNPENVVYVTAESGELRSAGFLIPNEEMTRTLKLPCSTIDGLIFRGAKSNKTRTFLRKEIIERLLSQNRSTTTGLLVCRIRGDDELLASVLTGMEFVKYDSLNIYQKNIRKTGKVTDRPVQSEVRDLQEVLSIIEKGVAQLKYGRLFADPRIGRSVATETYLRLSEKLLSGGAHLTVVRDSSEDSLVGVAIGVLDQTISETESIQYGVLWLIVVDPRFTGKGIGRKLFEKFCGEFGQQCDVLEIGTQVENNRAIRLYEGGGAVRVGRALTFHKWV